MEAFGETTVLGGAMFGETTVPTWMQPGLLFGESNVRLRERDKLPRVQGGTRLLPWPP
jgi:hypothetical protein